MIEFGRAPVTCTHCGPSYALVRDTATRASELRCDSCGSAVGTVESLSESLPLFRDMPVSRAVELQPVTA